MKILLFVASHEPYLSNNPIFLQFSRWLIQQDLQCMVSMPKTLDYLQFSSKIKIVYRAEKGQLQNESFLYNAKKLFLDDFIYTKFPLNFIREITWKPDKVFVFSDLFFDFEIYNNTWILNIFKARATPLVKVNSYQPLYDDSNSSIKEKHRQSLSSFSDIIFTHRENKIRVERALTQSLESKTIVQESNAINIINELSENDKITIYCPLPLKLEVYRQELLVEACSIFNKENKTVIEVVLNPLGLSSELNHLFNKNVVWHESELNNPICISAIYLVSEFGFCSEFNSLLSQKKIPVFTNLNNVFLNKNITSVKSLDIDSILCFLRLLKNNTVYSLTLDSANNESLFNKLYNQD